MNLCGAAGPPPGSSSRCDLWAGHEGDHVAHVGANWDNVPPGVELARWPAEAAPPAKIPGVKPLTIVETAVQFSLEEMVGRVVATRETHGELLQAYHKVWYEAPHTWHYLHFLGVGMMKCPNDLWMYQELMSALRPRVVIETGTYQGASALWFAFLMEMLGIDGKVYTVDFEDHRRVQHPRITFLGGDSRDPAVRDAIVEAIQASGPFKCPRCGQGPAWEGAGWQTAGDHCTTFECSGALERQDAGPILISLDADHSAAHVLAELELYAPLVGVGDYLVVEDTNISWGEPGDPSGDRGARGGIEDYLATHPGEFVQDVLCERWLLTMHPGGWLRRVAACDHGAGR